MNHIISVIKPPGISSHDLVAVMRRNLGIKRIGHGGTLDPGAAGIMILGTGRYTRLLEYILLQPKGYRAELTLGYSTSSMDMFSPITEVKDIVYHSDEEWDGIFKQFLGKQFQTPPMTSAVKIEGERLYNLARRNVEIDIPEREIEISEINLIANCGDKILIDISCSSGTYIRTLLSDIAKASGNLGVMSFLIRTSVGEIGLEDSTLPDESVKSLPWQKILSEFEHIALNKLQMTQISNGRAVKYPGKMGKYLCSYNDDLVAIGEIIDGEELLHPRKVFIR